VNGHDAERAYVSAMLDILDDRHDAVIESMRTDLNRLRDTWASGYQEQRAAHETRLAEIREASRSTDVAQGQVVGVSAVGSALPAMAPMAPGPEQPNADPRAAELAEAERIRLMPMDEFQRERERLIRPRGLFG
jgi:hypothetical protein